MPAAVTLVAALPQQPDHLYRLLETLLPHLGLGPLLSRAELEPLGGGGDGPDHAPYERALSLPINPGVEVVGDEAEREAVLFGEPRVAHELARAPLFAG